MIGKIIGGVIGKKVAERHGNGVRGMVLGALAPVVLRRAMGPLGLALAGGYAAKKYYDRRKYRTDYRPRGRAAF